MNHARRTLYVSLALLAFGCTRAEGGERGENRKTNPTGRVEVGLVVPDYRALSMAGDSLSLASHRGHVVLLNIWATWCIPCRVEVPVIERLHQRYGPKGLDVIGVSVDVGNKIDAIRSFTSSLGVTYPIWRDTHSEILKTFRSPGVPATFVIGRDGVLLYKYLGPIPEGDANMHRVIEEGLAR